MKKATAEAILAALEQTFARFGQSFDELMERAYVVRELMPPKLAEVFQYGGNRKAALQWLMSRPEPKEEEKANFAKYVAVAPAILGDAMRETAAQLPTLGDRRYKIPRKERVKVYAEVERAMAKTKSFPKAVAQIAERHKVGSRTVRRIHNEIRRGRP